MELFIILLHCCQMVKADDRKYYFRRVNKAFFISPIVDMEKVILDMMRWAYITEEKLREKQLITTGFGETLSWEYLCYVRNHPVNWSVPTVYYMEIKII